MSRADLRNAKLIQSFESKFGYLVCLGQVEQVLSGSRSGRRKKRFLARLVA